MRTRLIPAVLALGCTTSLAWADGGLSIQADQVPWPRLQARVALAPTLPLLSTDLASGGSNLQGGRVLGDYYFAGNALPAGFNGGFRATSGLLLGPRGASLAMPSVPRTGFALSVSQQGISPSAGPDTSTDNGHAVPYLGVGYTGLSLKGGWGFTADVGLMALNPSSGLRLRSGQSLDDTLHDMHITPVLQLGLSYSF
jgi:hypothetical protein